MPDPMVELEGVTRVFARGTQKVRALRGVDLSLEASEVVAIVGPSGSGKTTLLNVMAGLDRPTGGVVRVGGRDLATLDRRGLATFRRATMGFVFQFYNLLPYLSAVENVEVPLMLARVPRAERRGRALGLLHDLGLGDRTHHRPDELSGGEQQRVAIARALANDPPIILGDEPTGDLDSAAAQEVLTILRDLNRVRGTTIVLVTHDPRVASVVDRVVTLHDGLVVQDLRRGGDLELLEPVA